MTRGTLLGAVAGPTYKAREDYRTRRSGDEMDAADPSADFAATALDRPVADISDLKRAALMDRVGRDRRADEARERSRRTLLIALCVVLAVGVVLGVASGVLLALR